MPNTADSNPNPIDVHVGGLVRMRRKFLGISQDRLAEAINLTFQQVQKYERGTNRISASKLYEIAKALKTPVSYFFEGYESNNAEELASSASEQFARDFLITAEGIDLAQAYPRIRSSKLRRKVLELVRALSEDPDATSPHEKTD